MLNISPILSSPQICDSNGYTVLHTACSRAGIAAEQIIQKLVSAGAELNTTNKFCRTALHECVISNNMAGARIILGGGASKDILDSEGRTPKDLAVSRDCLEMVELLSSENTSEVSVKEKAREVEVSNPSPLGACALPKMTVEEEKEALRRRLAELEEGETKSLESSLKEKRLDQCMKELEKENEKLKDEKGSNDTEMTEKMNELQGSKEKEINNLKEQNSKLKKECKQYHDKYDESHKDVAVVNRIVDELKLENEKLIVEKQEIAREALAAERLMQLIRDKEKRQYQQKLNNQVYMATLDRDKLMKMEEEKEALRRRLAELEEGETKSLESSLKEKRLALEKVKVDFRKQREIARAEIFKLEQKIKVLNVLCEYPRIGH